MVDVGDTLVDLTDRLGVPQDKIDLAIEAPEPYRSRMR